MTRISSSPASSGPAGSQFEAQVGAHYLLSMLVGAEPRGLPGVSIDRIEFQRAGEGRPLDDVVVYGHDVQGVPIVLEIQVKRTVSFARTDHVFQSVVHQIAEASTQPDFWSSNSELGIAIARTSRKIDGPYQDVLSWALQLESADVFFSRIARPGSASDDMRAFVTNFKTHLLEGGSPDDDETVWQLLRRLQILVFDFTVRGSVSAAIAKERAIRALEPSEAERAGSLWANLVEIALDVAATGGSRNREQLIEDLVSRSFTLAGQHNYFAVRRLLSEAAQSALKDIGDTIGETFLARQERLVEVNSALDQSRYLEIRGNAGVGKSGLLKHLAEQVRKESEVLVLSPGRTTPRGWVAMRADLGFEGTAHDLLVDLASGGGGVLFLDGLDNFDTIERYTVIDLVRAAAEVPGFSVVATARVDFGNDEPNWLPSDAILSLGGVSTVTVDELSETEVEELRAAAPKLTWLLADDHPARDVVRNLFRLSRLADRTPEEALPRTEAEMARDWWKTADGEYGSGHRERARVIKLLAEKALLVSEPLDVSDAPAATIDALVKSETLRDLGNDLVTFRHDVFREWAIANLISNDTSFVRQLPLERPASGSLPRGVDIAARMLLEGYTDTVKWGSFFDEVSIHGAHGSWRRVALLALVRSEQSPQVLDTARSTLIANDAKLLRELIRNIMAVDVAAAASVFKSEDFGGAKFPDSFNIPNSAAWPRLILWLLSLGEGLPTVAIPDVSDFYMEWSAGTFGRDPLTPLVLSWLHKWLMEIESRHDAANFGEWLNVFGGELDHDRLTKLESDLRAGFLLFCKITPNLAVEYLRMLTERGADDQSSRAVLKFRGTLAQAAPKELAEFTARALLPKAEKRRTKDRRNLDGPFGVSNSAFLPASPTQGPFLELLVQAPDVGLNLIRRLVNHAIEFYSGDLSMDENAVKVVFPEGVRTFPWMQSYTWSRQSRDYCLTSALMALEAWAHQRIESGDPFEEVLGDVLGEAQAPGAYLLIAVDLVLSHWPKSLNSSIPFLACPELLCADRERQVYDTLPETLGFPALNPEPLGAVDLASLSERPSRQLTLDQLLGHFAVSGDDEKLNQLNSLLDLAVGRLDPPSARSDLGDPEFMVVHAKNVLDPGNWGDSPRELPDGTTQIVTEYVPPDAERQQLEALKKLASNRANDTNMEATISLALEDPSRSSPEFAAAAVTWAQSSEDSQNHNDEGAGVMREQAVAGAAMIVMRDGDRELRDKHKAWTRGVFVQALAATEDSGRRFRSGLRFNSIASAFAGAVYLLRDGVNRDDVKLLLDLASLEDPGGAHGLGVVRDALNTIDDKLLRAVLRSAFTSSIRPLRNWDLTEEDTLLRLEEYKAGVEAAVNLELSWIFGNSHEMEPEWPEFPENRPRLRRRLRLPGPTAQQTEHQVVARRKSDFYLDYQGAALWLRHAALPVGDATPKWVLKLIQDYGQWTAKANGSGLGSDEELRDEPTDWNDIYYELLSYCLSDLGEEGIEELLSAVVSSLPDEPFLDIAQQFLRGLDLQYFGYQKISTVDAVKIRWVLADRLIQTSEWRWLSRERSNSVGMHIGPAVAAFFMNDFGFTQPPKCYLLPDGIERIAPFLPNLERLIEAGSCLFVALVSLNLLEVFPKTSHLSIVLLAASTWLLDYQEDTDFWVDRGIGRRVCGLIDELVTKDTDSATRDKVDRILSELVRLGVAEASRLEVSLTTRL